MRFGITRFWMVRLFWATTPLRRWLIWLVANIDEPFELELAEWLLTRKGVAVCKVPLTEAGRPNPARAMGYPTGANAVIGIFTRTWRPRSSSSRSTRCWSVGASKIPI